MTSQTEEESNSQSNCIPLQGNDDIIILLKIMDLKYSYFFIFSLFYSISFNHLTLVTLVTENNIFLYFLPLNATVSSFSNSFQTRTQFSIEPDLLVSRYGGVLLVNLISLRHLGDVDSFKYSFNFQQDAAQFFHWNNTQAALQPYDHMLCIIVFQYRRIDHLV